MARQTFCKAEIRKSVITTIDDRTIGSDVKHNRGGWLPQTSHIKIDQNKTMAGLNRATILFYLCLEDQKKTARKNNKTCPISDKKKYKIKIRDKTAG